MHKTGCLILVELDKTLRMRKNGKILKKIKKTS